MRDRQRSPRVDGHGAGDARGRRGRVPVLPARGSIGAGARWGRGRGRGRGRDRHALARRAHGERGWRAHVHVELRRKLERSKLLNFFLQPPILLRQILTAPL